MTILLTILVIIAALVVFLLIIAAFTKKEFRLERQVRIEVPAPRIFDFISHIRNQEQYSVWILRDPAIKIVYTGTDGKPGFISTWESDDRNVGAGAQEIRKVNDGKSIEVEIRFRKPFVATNLAVTSVTAIDETSSLVSNSLSGRSKFPMNIMNLVLERLVGNDMEQTLLNLKKILEQQ